MEQFFYANLEGKLWAFRQYAQTFFRLFIIPIIMNLSLCGGAAWAKEFRCSDLLREMLTKTPSTDTAILAQNWRQLYRKKLAEFLAEPSIPQKISTHQPDHATWDARQALIDAYEGMFQRIMLQDTEMQILEQSLNEFPTDLTSLNVLEEYVLFTRTLKKQHQPLALKEVATTLATAKDKSIAHAKRYAKAAQQSSWQKRFWSQQNKIEQAYQKRKARLAQESNNTHRHPELAAKSQQEKDTWVENEAQNYRTDFRDKWNGCHTRGKTPEYSAVRKQFFLYSMAIGTSSSALAFTFNNHHFIDEGQADIFDRRLKYELVETFVWRLLSYFITIADNWGFTQKAITYIGIDNILSYVSGRAWDYFVGSKERKDERPLQEAMAYVRTNHAISPDLKETQAIDTFLERLWQQGDAVPIIRDVFAELMNINQVPSPTILHHAGLLAATDINNSKAIKAAADQYWAQFGQQSLDVSFLIKQGLLQDADRKDQTKIAQASAAYWEDFGRQFQEQTDEQVQALMSLVAKDIYLDLAEEAYLSSGTSVGDRYGFYSAYAFFMVPTDLLFMQIVYRALCMSSVAPQYFYRALVYFAAFRLFVNFTAEHTTRKMMINQ